jgi:hypothetical protein
MRIWSARANLKPSRGKINDADVDEIRDKQQAVSLQIAPVATVILSTLDIHDEDRRPHRWSRSSNRGDRVAERDRTMSVDVAGVRRARSEEGQVVAIDVTAQCPTSNVGGNVDRLTVETALSTLLLLANKIRPLSKLSTDEDE